MKQDRILLVDDEEIVLETVGDDLREAGFDVTEAHNGVEGLLHIEERKFDLVISDLIMDGMDGFGVLRAVKKISPETPVIIITGYPSAENAKKALMLGAREIIIKPSETADIFKAVRSHIDSSKSG